jgi:hypothetical protein
VLVSGISCRNSSHSVSCIVTVLSLAGLHHFELKQGSKWSVSAWQVRGHFTSKGLLFYCITGQKGASKRRLVRFQTTPHACMPKGASKRRLMRSNAPKNLQTSSSLHASGGNSMEMFDQITTQMLSNFAKMASARGAWHVACDKQPRGRGVSYRPRTHHWRKLDGSGVGCTWVCGAGCTPQKAIQS